MGSNLTATLDIKLIDDVSKPAKSVAAALKEAENAAKAVAKGMAGTGATDRFVKNLSGLKLAGKDIETVAKAWKDYAKSAGLAADSTKWTKTQRADVLAWERQNLSALRTVKREQIAYHKALASAGTGGVSPMAAAMSQSAMANQRMLIGMGAFGKRGVQEEQAPKQTVGQRIRGKFSGTATEFASGMIMGSVPMLAGMKAYEAGKQAFHASAERQHERTMSLNAGMTPEEVRKSERLSLSAQRVAPNLSVSEIMELHKEARSAVKEVHEADEILPTLAKAKAILKGSGIENANVTDFVKAAETYGFSANEPRMEKYIESQVKSAMVLGRTITTEEARDIARYSKTAGGTYSDRFINTTMPSLMQELGGSQAGNALFMLSKHLRGGMQNKHVPVEVLNSLGLLEDPSKIVRSKTGSIKGYKGKVVGDSMLATDPDKWVWEVFKPALEKAGYTAFEDQTRIIQQSMPGTAANVVSKLLQQEGTFKTHAQRYEKTPSLDAMVANQKVDPTVAAKNLSTAFDNLSAATIKSEPIARYLVAMADGINGIIPSVERFLQWNDKILNRNLEWAKKAQDAWDNSTLGKTVARQADIDAAKVESPAGTRPSSKEAFAKYTAPDLRPSFSKFGDEAFRVGTRKKPAEPQMAAASPVGVQGGITPSAAPAFTRMQATPSVDTSQLDATKAKINDIQSAISGLNTSVAINVNTSSVDSVRDSASQAKASLDSLNTSVSPHVDASSIDAVQGKAANAHVAVTSLNMTATPFVNTGSIDSAIAKANQLHSALASIGAAANAAAASVHNAAAAAGAAAARMGSLKSRASSDYSTAGDPAK